MEKTKNSAKKTPLSKGFMVLWLFILVFALATGGCQSQGLEPGKDDLVISSDEVSFIINENLLEKMEEDSQDSLTIYSHMTRT